MDVGFCLLADNAINLALKEIKAYISTHPIKSLKNIVIRSLNDQTLIAMVCSKKENLLPLAEHLKQSLKNFGLYLVENPRHDSVVIAGKISFIYGLKNIGLTDKIKMSIDVDSFYQTNSQIQTELYNHILNNLTPHDVVVNGYSGAGLLSALAAQKAKKVYGIEINKTSHKNAENLKKVNKIGNLTNILGDFFKNLKNISNFNTVILDPSKKGCGAEVMRAIDGVEKIFYVSCNPIALAKDLKIIKDNYTIVSLTPFDMFPQTISVETCVVLNKNQT